MNGKNLWLSGFGLCFFLRFLRLILHHVCNKVVVVGQFAEKTCCGYKFDILTQSGPKRGMIGQ